MQQRHHISYNIEHPTTQASSCFGTFALSRKNYRQSKSTMEDSDHAVHQMMNEPLLRSAPKGGFRTIPFILATEAFQKVGAAGIGPNMIVYLMEQYHMEMASGTNLLFLWSSVGSFMPFLGGIAADSFVGRYSMISFGSIVGFLGMSLLFLTTLIPQARPPECTSASNHSCIPATFFQLFLLCTSFGLISIGVGGINSSCLAFGADQLKKVVRQEDGRFLEICLSWYYGLGTFSMFLALICIVYIQENMGWKVGFGVPVILMFLSTLSFLLGSPFYVKLKAKSDLILELVQVIAASFRKRHVKLSSESENTYHHKNGSRLILPSEKLRFLNRACIVVDPKHDLTMDAKARDPWSLCTVDQVEDLKTLLRVIPLWSTGMIMAVNACQNSFQVLQATSMNRNIGLGFQIPAGSFGTFAQISIVLWVVLYHRALLPMASRILGKPFHLSTKRRMGAGIFVSCLSMILAAIIENIRRNRAIREGKINDPKSVIKMSAMWLIPQYCLVGFSQGLNTVAQNEFYYSEFPSSMSSIASTLCSLGNCLANLLASLILSSIDDLTRRGGKESWISSNINQGHYDYYCWFLASLSMINMIYLLICSKVYGPCKGEKVGIPDEEY